MEHPSCLSISRLIIDDVEINNERTLGLLGGGGVYAIFGMRIVTKRVAYVIKFGTDFNPTKLRQLGIFLREIVMPFDTPRAIMSYHDNIPPSFKLLTENYDKFRTECSDLPLEFTLNVTHLHGVLTWHRIEAIVKQWPQFFIIWEPNQDCIQIPERKPDLIKNWDKCITSVFITSPNHVEAVELLCREMPSFLSNLEAIQYFIGIAKDISSNNKCHIVLRCSYYGSVINYNGEIVYIPPYYTNSLLGKEKEEEIVDSTGCGNAYLGALTAFLSITDNSIENVVLGCYYGSIAAGLTIEQFGPYSFENDMFNNSTIEDRMLTYKYNMETVKLQYPSLFSKYN